MFNLTAWIGKIMDSGGRRAPVLNRDKRARLNVEVLERRDCPTLAITLDALVLPNHYVQLSGVVTGDYAAGANVNISGAASEMTMADSNGNFSVTTSSASLGTVYAQAMDSQLNSSNTASDSIAVAAPSISLSFTAFTANSVTVSGTVTGIDPGLQTVIISGVAEASPMTDQYGNFSATVNVWTGGTVYASVMDSWTQSGYAQRNLVVTSAAVDIDYEVAKNMSFQASAGVGLLTDLYESWSQNFSVATITTNEGTFSAGQTADFTSGAQLTVASDGGLTFSPAADFTGTESFTFTATYGGETEWATIYLVVVDPENAESEDEFSFTNAGSLQYIGSVQNISESESYQDTMTVSQVPFFTCLQGRRIIIGNLCDPLPDVTYTTNLEFADQSTSTIISRLWYFSECDGLELISHIREVRFDLYTAINALDGYWNQNLPASVARWFAGTDFETGDENVLYYTVKTAFQDVAAGLDTETTLYLNDPEDEGFGYLGFDDEEGAFIGIAAGYYTGNPGSNLGRDRYGTVIHELTHLYAGTTDWGYFNNPAAIQGQAIEWRDDPNDEDPLPEGFMTTVRLLSNADSYAGYLAQYFYAWL